MAYKIKSKKLKEKSIYEAPVGKIRKDFKKAYGRYPTSDELNDIILEGEY